GAAEDFAPGPVDDAPRGAGLRGRTIGPIDIRTEIGGPQHRTLQSRPTNISTTRLDQQDAAGGIFGQARRQGAAGRTRTDNNVVIGSRNVAPVLTLSDGGRQHLIGQGPGACRPEAGGRRQLQESPSIELTSSGAPLDTGQEALMLVIAFVCHSVVPFASHGSWLESRVHLAARRGGDGEEAVGTARECACGHNKCLYARGAKRRNLH